MLLKHNLVLLVGVQVTRSQKQFLQALFAQNMHLSGIEKKQEWRGIESNFDKIQESGPRTFTGDERENQRLEENYDHAFFQGYM